MPSFVIETYLSRADPQGLDRDVQALRTAVEAASVGRPGMRYLRSVFVPTDETCLHFIEAPSAEVVAEVGSRAALAVDRILEATAPETHPER